MYFRYVSDVIIEAPFTVSVQLLKQFDIDAVCRGVSSIDHPENDSYAIPKAMSKFRLVDSESTMTRHTIIKRIVANRLYDIVPTQIVCTLDNLINFLQQ